MIKSDEERAKACVDVLRRNTTWDEDVDTIATELASVRADQVAKLREHANALSQAGDQEGALYFDRAARYLETFGE